MLIRLLSTFAMLGMMMSSGYSSSSADAPEEERMGGEGFGGVVGVFAFLATAVLLVLIVLAVLSLTGQFESEFADPVT